MQRFTDVTLDRAALKHHALPDIAYPIPERLWNTSRSGDPELPLALMLHGLQQYASSGQSRWLELEPTMDRLAALLALADEQEVSAVQGMNWWLELGPVDLDGKLVTVQREDHLIAAIAARPDGRLRVAIFRPLDARSLRYLTSLGQVPHPRHGVSMRENNWEYALDSTAGAANAYAHARGESYLSYWQKGLGILSNGSEVPEWREQRNLVPRPEAVVKAELAAHFMPSPDDRPTADSPPKRSQSSARRTQTRHAGSKRDRFLGCLLGGAVGDALGAPVEFMSRREILDRFGPDGITQYVPAYGALGTITDDTQMSLFTAEGLLRAWVRGCLKGITTFTGVTAHAYLRWLHTQGELPAQQVDATGKHAGWLVQQRGLHHRRAPGNTCLSALRAMRSFGDAARNDSKGCGGVMRMAPLGLFFAGASNDVHASDVFDLGSELAALTHGHPTGQLTAGVLAVMILELTNGASLQQALSLAKTLLQDRPGHEETLRALESAERLAASDLTPAGAIAQLGEGWVAEEALAVSVYCALVATDFRHGLVLAVNHDGDSDSTGSITGNLLGTAHGIQAIPGEWVEPLELRDVITEVADDLYGFRDWGLTTYGCDEDLRERIWRKYPGY